MGKLQVWKKVPRSTMGANRRCVKHKWVFEIKRSGIFRARLAACGYSQVPGVDFTEVYAPVANDVTYRLLVITSVGPMTVVMITTTARGPIPAS